LNIAAAAISLSYWHLLAATDTCGKVASWLMNMRGMICMLEIMFWCFPHPIEALLHFVPPAHALYTSCCHDFSLSWHALVHIYFFSV
jgi:hypothetical protein